jgi:hypothetical protein
MQPRGAPRTRFGSSGVVSWKFPGPHLGGLPATKGTPKPLQRRGQYEASDPKLTQTKASTLELHNSSPQGLWSSRRRSSLSWGPASTAESLHPPLQSATSIHFHRTGTAQHFHKASGLQEGEAECAKQKQLACCVPTSSRGAVKRHQSDPENQRPEAKTRSRNRNRKPNPKPNADSELALEREGAGDRKSGTRKATEKRRSQ